MVAKVQQLLESKADANGYEKEYSEWGNPTTLLLPLHTALLYERSTIIPMLLEYKADPHKLGSDDSNALGAASSRNNMEYVKMFVAMGVDHHKRDDCRMTPLTWAVEFDAWDAAVFLSNVMNQDTLLPFLVWLKKNNNLSHHCLFTTDALRSIVQLSVRQVVCERNDADQPCCVMLK
jgi:hypothetical protein